MGRLQTHDPSPSHRRRPQDLRGIWPPGRPCPLLTRCRAAAPPTPLEHRHGFPSTGPASTAPSVFSMGAYVEGEPLIARGPAPPAPPEGGRLLADVARPSTTPRARHPPPATSTLHVLNRRDGSAPHPTFRARQRVAVDGRRARGTTTGPSSYAALHAPEQVFRQSRTPSPVSDVYSLGVILYRCSRAGRPQSSPHPVDTLLQCWTMNPVRPRLLNPSYTRTLSYLSEMPTKRGTGTCASACAPTWPPTWTPSSGEKRRSVRFDLAASAARPPHCPPRDAPMRWAGNWGVL